MSEIPKPLHQWLEAHEELVGYALFGFFLLWVAVMVLLIGSIAWRVIV